jgi:hypothetical protein
MMDDQEQAHAQCTGDDHDELVVDVMTLIADGAETNMPLEDIANNVILACRTPAGCSGVDRDDIAERIDDRFEDVSYGLASQIGDEILKHFKVEKR